MESLITFGGDGKNMMTFIGDGKVLITFGRGPRMTEIPGAGLADPPFWWCGGGVVVAPYDRNPWCWAGKSPSL